VQGRGVNSPLNENGILQAQAFYEAYKHIPFDKIYASTLLRTHQTVAPFVAQGIPMEELEGLDEISWGNNDLDLAIVDGESPNSLVLRQKEAIAHILANKEEETVLVCMHGRAMRIMLCHLTNVPVCNMDDFPHTNTALYVLEYEDNEFSIVDYYNTKHLENLMNEKN